MGLYHVSENAHLMHMLPRIPETAYEGFEDVVTPRVCFSTSIDGAIIAIDPLVHPKLNPFLYVYKPVDYDINLIHRPTYEEVPDVIITNEIWYLGPIDVYPIGIVRINSSKDLGQFVSTINDRYSFYVRSYEYDLHLYKNGDELMRG